MENNEKKIVLVIVEGKSDKDAFQKCINNYLSLLSNQVNIDCEIYQTDITLHNFCNDKVISSDEIDERDMRKRICDSIANFLIEQKGSYIRAKDIAAIAILSDLDACYCCDDNIISIPSTKNKYDLECQKINTNDVPFQKQINRWKRDSYSLLNSISSVKYKENNEEITLPVKCFYQSINLEHITSNNPNISDEATKVAKAKDFRNSYKDKPIEFYNLISSISIIGTDYLSSWSEKELKENSFKCMANIKFLVDWLTSMFKGK